VNLGASFAENRKSLNVENAILKKTNLGFDVCAEGMGILVAMDYIENASIQIPELWRTPILAFEKKEP
jgi:hypothetical protein